MKKWFDKFASDMVTFTGSPTAFMVAFAAVLAWALAGPFFGFSEQWQMVINTGTTIITFLMVFLIQKAQNKDSRAIQIKLNELLAAHDKASNRIVSVEDLTEEEMHILQKFYSNLSQISLKHNDLQTSHSIEEAHQNNEEKAEKN